MIFNKNVDWLLVAVPTIIAVYLFYGLWAALLSALLLAAFQYARPIDRYFSNYWPRAIFAAGVILLLSPLFRLIFTADFCVGAPMSPLNGFANATAGMTGTEFGVGSYIVQGLYDRCLGDVWDQTSAAGGIGWPRDYVYPVLGALGLVFGLLKRDREVSL